MENGRDLEQTQMLCDIFFFLHEGNTCGGQSVWKGCEGRDTGGSLIPHEGIRTLAPKGLLKA